MTQAGKLELIGLFAQSAEPFLVAVLEAPSGALDWRPHVADAWTVREHLAHFLDADIFAYTRLRLCVAEPGATVYVWDGEKWKNRLEYGKSDLGTTVGAIRIIRKLMSETAEALSGRDWDTLFIEHPERGRMTIADILELYSGHPGFHLEFVKRNLGSFRV